MRSSILILLGILTILSAQARAQEFGARENIIQGARDDVRRHIQERDRQAPVLNERQLHHHEPERGHR